MAEEVEGLPRDVFLKALSAEGVPGFAGYDRPLQQQPLFTERRRLAAECPTSCLYDGLPPDYEAVATPVTARLCSRESCWLPQSVLLAGEDDIRDIVRAVEKVIEHRRELRDRAVV